MNVNTNELPKNCENWAAIDGYKNYQVSWWGRVRNAKTGRILKGNLSSAGYPKVELYKKGIPKTHNIHQLVAREWVPNPEGKRCVDHIDSDKTNNHHENLRAATHADNMKNRSKRANTTSDYYGVCWHKNSAKWNAQIQIGGKRTNLGNYTDEKEAAAVFNAAAIEHYGEFAKLNDLT